MHRLIGTLVMALSLAAAPALASDVSYDQRNPTLTQTKGPGARTVTNPSEDSSRQQDEGSGAGEAGAPCPAPSEDPPSSSRSSLQSEVQSEFLKSIWTSA